MRPHRPSPKVPSERRRYGIPPLWFTLLAMGLGIYGTSLLYQGLLGEDWASALIGFAIMAAAVLLLGTPLAFARYLRWHAQQSRRLAEKGQPSK
ncbi:hypothetical protein D2Q93_07065 [Alicyclobacillaceae bacterium I2511]|nr:hypothetical protein D2Q93_07065 [Alicyclobacillaceae bacterium I2511]